MPSRLLARPTPHLSIYAGLRHQRWIDVGPVQGPDYFVAATEAGLGCLACSIEVWLGY